MTSASAKPPVAERYAPARLHTIEEAIPAPKSAELGRWLYEHRGLLERAGNGEDAFAHVLLVLDDHIPDLVAAVRVAVLEALPEALEIFGVEPHEPGGVTIGAALYHHGGFHGWTRGDLIGVDFDLTLRTDPPMFHGGELEFLDGRTVDPENGRLTLMPAAQLRRVRLVECWSAHVLHGRWSIVGHVGVSDDRS